MACPLESGRPSAGPSSAEGAGAGFGRVVPEQPGLASAVPVPRLSHVSQIHIALDRCFVLFGEIIKEKSLSHWLIIKFSA